MRGWLLLLCALPAGAGAEELCTYSTYAWSSARRAAVGRRTVRKPKGALSAEERDPHEPRCTVCREDQATVRVRGLPPVTVCRVFAAQITEALTAIRDSKRFDLLSLKGYRPGRTRGPVRHGLRTVFSNHSYGTALDINAAHNALYRRCATSGVPQGAGDIAHCQRGVGGAWDPRARPRTTVVEGGVVHRAFSRFWRWGGALRGPLKDFMHFSVTGR